MTKAKETRLMEACLRLARRNHGQTGTNPSVGTVLVKDGLVIGKGITAKGGRPHAERRALDQARANAKGATAYVSLEPCAHHGATPPCAQTLINSGVTRVVTAWTDPDSRVDGKGHSMLREAGIDVEIGLCAEMAEYDLSGYISRKMKNRPKVIVKLAVSADGKLGNEGQEVAITGQLAKSYVHRMRAEYDAILVGKGTAECDDPDLTCRLKGLEHRSPHRFVLDTNANLNPDSNLANTANKTPVSVISATPDLPKSLSDKGVRHFAADVNDGSLALPEILEDMASLGISTLMVEGGAKVVSSFLAAGLIDEIFLFTSDLVLGDGAIASPISSDNLPHGYSLARSLKLGDDHMEIYRKSN